MDSFVLFGERAIENRLSGEGNAASINYMTFRCRTKLLTASLAPVPRQNAICGECLWNQRLSRRWNWGHANQAIRMQQRYLPWWLVK